MSDAFMTISLGTLWFLSLGVVFSAGFNWWTFFVFLVLTLCNAIWWGMNNG